MLLAFLPDHAPFCPANAFAGLTGHLLLWFAYRSG